MIKYLSFVFASLLLLTTSAFGVTLAWDANPEPDIAGYVLHYGISSGQYTNAVNVGNVTNATISGLVSNVTYYFSVTALNTSGLESPPSNEVAYTVDGVRPIVSITYPLPGTLLTNANITMTGTANDNVRVSQVLYQLNGGLFLVATGTTNWSAPLTLTVGTNTISVKSVDTTGNTSILVSENVVYATKPSTPTGLRIISLTP